MAVSPSGPVTGTTPPPTSSIPSSTTTDTNNSSSSSPSPTIATDSNTSPSNPPSSTIATELNTSASHSPRVEIIGGSIGGGGFLIVLVVIFRLRRQKNRLRDFDRAAAVIDPFTPTTPVSNPLPERKEPLSMPISNRKAVEGSDHSVVEPTAGEQSTDFQQPHTERDDGDSGETTTLGDDNRYRAVQAQIRLLMQRMERIEGVEEAPPEYVSAYGSGR
ncbi:hypothetical protein AAF712_014883 [Marasmius tenuissimus]|uniref:Uncharacterized protein n=1 Tax=Marasmius tenuissimus TaxID=585030 RepID=A0ABR2ZBW6_9AGAR